MSKNRPTIQDKQKSTEESADSFDFTDQLAISPAILAEIKEKGLKHRWINAHKLQANYGFDSRQWQPYRVENIQKSAFGSTDAEGYIRRGDLVLAVQSEAIAKRRYAIVERKNAINKNHLKNTAEQFREEFKKAGIKTKVEEGYGEED
jgi:hypothetical protein